MALEFDRVRLQQSSFSLAVDWSIGPGLTAIVGPSGAGKSTLLSAVAGFLDPVEGRVNWNGEGLNGVPPAKRPVATLFQDHNLFPHLSLAQNCGLALGPKRSNGADPRVMDALARVGLEGLEARRPAEVSGGQQSRAALARVLMQDRAIVCLDEPFSALGPGQRRELLQMSARMLQGRVTLLVTHDPEEAVGVAERAIFVSDGVAHPPVSMDDLLKNPPAALARYLGRSRS